MPKRPKQHEINEIAERTFQDSLPPAWVVNPFIRDYAKDFFVEVVADGDVTGKVFVVQLKGKESPRRQPRNNTIDVPIDTEHLRYYLHHVPLPVFLVAVDTRNRVAYFEFAQRQIEEVPRLRKRLAGSGKVNFPVRLDQKLADTGRLLEELEQAWRFMRDRYPGSVLAATKYRQRELEQLDPRFEYVITTAKGHEQIILKAKEPVHCTIKVKGRGDEAKAKIARFFDEGAPIAAGETVQIEVEGSPIFSSGGGIAKAEWTPNRPIEVRFTAISPDLGRADLPEFRGNLAGGLKRQHFSGSLEKCPFRLAISIESKSSHGCIAHFDCSWHYEAWIGSSLTLLPWFDAIKCFVAALADDQVTFALRVSSHGSVLLDSTGVASCEMRAFQDLSGFVDLLDRARHVCRVLGLEVSMPRDWSDQDYDDVDELCALVNTGEYTHQNRFDFSCTMRLSDEQAAAFKASSGRFRIQSPGSTFSFLGATFDFSDTFVELSDWRNVTAVRDVTGPSDAYHIEMIGCRKRVLWPRFLPPDSGTTK